MTSNNQECRGKNDSLEIVVARDYFYRVTVNRPMEKLFCVYILASKRNGTLYVGVTSALAKRVWEHKSKAVAGFTSRYNVDTLVYYEPHPTAESAIQRETQLKRWRRAWKLSLIESVNPSWRDLYEDIV